MATLTTANSVIMMSVANLFTTPVQLQGYATDDAFTAEEVETGETYMGVDGILSGGFTPYPIPIQIHLQADSVSNNFFDSWISAEAQAREKYIADATILIQGTGALYTLTRGFLMKTSVMPEAKKILQPRIFNIEFNSISLAPV